MRRRDVLKLAIAAGLPATAAGWVHYPTDRHFGALPRVPKKRGRQFHAEYPEFKNVSRAIDKNVLLYQNLQKEIGEIVPHDQSGTLTEPGEGDCVGHATAMACDILAATNKHMFGKRERWPGKASVEMIYAGSRVEIGGDVITGAGSHGEWAAKYVRNYGVLHRKLYGDIDLTGYSPSRSRKYRHAGVPDELEAIARQRPVLETTNVHTGQEALDAVCAGQPVLMCSSYAFPNTRDKYGFTKPYLNERRGWKNVRRKWFHALCATGAILEGNRVGVVIQNSHGDWNSGPRPWDIPRGSFIVDLEYIDLMVRDWYDCYALASYRGEQSKQMFNFLVR